MDYLRGLQDELKRNFSGVSLESHIKKNILALESYVISLYLILDIELHLVEIIKLL